MASIGTTDSPPVAPGVGHTRGLLGRLALTNIANCDTFTGQGIPTAWGRLYGGQAITQSLMAAQATVPAARGLFVHSLHGYFILAGNPAIPILFQVERVRDGKSFATRMVRAVQANRCIFQMIVSFHRDEVGGPSYQIPITDLRGFTQGRWLSGNDVPTPQALLDSGVVPDRHNNSTWMSILKVADGDRWMLRWFKYNHRGEVPLTRAQESAVLAYLSDMQLVATVRQPHGQEVFSMSISLDHSIHFHRRLDPTQWLLCFCETTTSSGSRGIARTQVFQDKVLVATISQEALIRVPREANGGGGKL
jgi:acyl-CoA thioesterase II